ncbi:MAG: S9 family peptidase [Bacteroidales bacterium]|nr:S9 family peptidase [Bacteroidales bacterium]
MNIRSRLLLLLFAAFLFTAAQAQKQKFDTFKDALFASGQLNGQGGPANMTWIEGGAKYSFTKNNQGAQEIWTHTMKNGREEMVFTTKDLVVPGTEQGFRYVSFQWTKDFKYLFFKTNFRPIWRNSGNSDYFSWSVEEKSLSLIVASAFSAEISPDGAKVGYGKDGELLVFDLASGKHTQLTNDAALNKYNGRFGWAQEEEFGLVQGWIWSPESKYMAYWQTDETEVPIYKLTDFSGDHPEYMEVPYPKVGDPIPVVKIGVLNTADDSQKWLNFDLEDGYVPRMYWTNDADKLAVVWLNREQNHLKLYMVDVASETKTVVLEEKSQAWIDVSDFFGGRLHHFYFPDELKSFFFISESDGYAHIYHYDYDGNLLNQITKGDFEVIGIDAFDLKKEKIYFTSAEVSPLERHLFVARFDGSKKKQLTSEAGQHAVSVSPDGKYYLDIYSNVSTPKQVEMWNTKGKMIGKMVDNQSVLEFLEKTAYAPKELFSFTTADGQKLDGYVIKPIDFDPNKSYPLVLSVYGGPGSQGVYNSWEGNPFTQFLAHKGYVVANVNNRGNGGYGDAFEKSVYKQLGYYESKDFVETAQYLAKTHSWLDGERMAIYGHSYGGYTSAFTMLTHPGVFKASIVAAPVTDHLFYDCILTERSMGLKENNADGYKQSSVITHAGNLEGKLLLAHSLMDENVHPQNTFQLVNAFNMAGKDFELKIYPPGAHGIATDLTTYLLLQEQYMKFLETNLK